MAVLLVLASAPGSRAALAADAPTLWTAADVKWSDVPEIAGAKQALLWGDPKTGEHGTLNRWKANTKAPLLARTQDLHVVVMAGTFTIDLEPEGYREFGPGAFIRVPKGAKHTLGCEAAGECIFVMHQPGPGEILK